VPPATSLTFANIIDVLSKRANFQVKYLAVISREADYEDNQETDGAVVYKQMLIDGKLQFGNKVKKTEPTGGSPLRREGLHWTVVPQKKKKK
jgi:hypothetical protein